MLVQRTMLSNWGGLNAGGLNKTLNRAWLDQATPAVKFRTSSRGYILPIGQYAEPDITIAFLGGSTTECSYVSENLRFPAYVSHLLAKRGIRANTINGGRSGNTTQDAINILINDLVMTPPDIVVLMEATNDLGVLSQDPVYQSRMATPVTAKKQANLAFQSASSNFSVIGFVREKLTSIINSKYENSRPIEVAEGINQLYPREVEERYLSRLRAFILIARAYGSKPVLMTQPLAPQKHSLTPGLVKQPAAR
jgi:lysophospholipase L1-like esterase